MVLSITTRLDFVLTGAEAVEIHSSSVGTGKPILLVHGWGSSSATFAALQPALGEVGEAIAVDLRGFGKTGISTGQHGVRDMAADLAELARRTGPVVAIGHSMGGSVVSHLALEYPELVRGLVVIDPAYGADDDECSGLAQRRSDLVALGAQAAVRDLSQAFSPSLPQHFRDEALHDLAASDARVLLESFDGMYMAPDALGPLPQARLWLAYRHVPVLALYATAKAAAIEAEISPASKVLVAPGPGHYVHLEHPAWTSNAIVQWLRQSELL